MTMRMTLQNFDLGESLLATCRFDGDALTESDEGSTVSLDRILGSTTVSLSFHDGRMVLTEPADQRARSVTNTLHGAGLAKLVSVLTVGTQKVVLQGRTFASAMSFPSESPLEISITERIVDDLPVSAKSDAIGYLSQQFLLDDCAFVLSSPKQTGADFTFLGPEYRMHVALRNGIPHALRISRRPKGWVPSAPVRLLRGTIKFTDATLSAALRSANSSELTQSRGAGEYLSSWEIYNELEAHHLKVRLNDFGFVRYTSWKRMRKNNKIVLQFDFADPLPERLQHESVDVEATATKPLVDSDTGNIILPEDLVPVGEMLPGGDSHTAALVSVAQSSDWVRPPASGYLLPSVRGSKVQVSRRERALRRVIEGDTPLPTLEILLERGDAPTADSSYREPRSQRALAALHNAPTDAQREALDVALNSPDIALIQGPPGTGKTSVIRALITRWSELQERAAATSSDDKTVPGILIASAQHDAVDNAVEGFDIDGLPAYRLGGRSSGDQESRLRSLSEWIRERQAVCAGKLREFGETPGRGLARDVDRLIAQWRNIQGADNQDVLRQILELVRPHITTELLHELSKFVVAQAAGSVQTPPNMKDDNARERLQRRLLTLLSSQRLTSEEFSQDGLFQVRRLVDFLEVHGSELGIDFPRGLEDVLEEEHDAANAVEKLTAALQMIDSHESDKSEVERSSGTVSHEDTVDLLLVQVSTAVHDVAAKGKDGVAEALAAYKDELEDLDSVKRMIEKYSGVLAATCQQSVMSDYKSVDYDLVVIDEAARVSPMDLLIPMSHGKRIVLVGDHKQLPHMLEPEVKESFIKSGRGNRQFVEESLFQRLFEKFTAVQSSGGTKRVVTLLDDYRMHPVIGSFVSSTFYPDVNLQSRRKPEERAHNLGMYDDCPVAWIDVPRIRGAESGPPSYSKSRAAEITVVVEEASTVLQKNSTFTLGIITFYEQQATKLRDQLELLPVELRARMQVGTVDAFQGREFDVVLMSTVRSNTHRGDLRKRVGFLDSPNRLCVAFSRAKRLLIVVGDSETVAGSDKQPAVPCFRAFLGLCSSKGGWYERR